VSERGLDADDDLAYVREYEHITLARVLLAHPPADPRTRSPGPARRLLVRLLAGAEDGRRVGSTIEILVLLSLAQQARGDQRQAAATLEQALARAGPEGYVATFADELPGLAPLLRAVPARGSAGEHARRVLAAASSGAAGTPAKGSPAKGSPATGSPVGAARQGLVDELSDRERQVLHLLRGDLSGPEIARELIVSLNTVRTHTKNIYMKLGVNNRREAVRRAAELDL
jgi:LuxR family maltose regulon positive regulatory protein